MVYRSLLRTEVELLREIDRSEVIENIYYHRNGQLVLEDEFYDMKGFPSGELDQLVNRLYKIFDQGGIVLGAFDDQRIAGIAALENKVRGRNHDRLKMDILHVSLSYRGQGVGTKLMELIKAEGKSIGAKKLYISATPSKNTIDFYLRMGCMLTDELDEELYNMEPEDIHLDLLL